MSASAAIIRLFVKQQDLVLLVSCQSDEPSQDILDLAAAIEDIVEPQKAMRVRVIAGRMDRSIGGAFSFVGKLLSMLKEIASAKIVVLDAYCPAISIPKKIKGQKVIQVWHAPEAIKKFSLQITDTPAGYSNQTTKILKMHKNYDFILCPAEATLPFFEEAFGYPKNAFVKYGLPSLKRLGSVKKPEAGETESQARIETKKTVQEGYPELGVADVESTSDRPLIIVYAPTFRDGTNLDVAGLIAAFEQTMPEIMIVLKLHPLDAVKNNIYSSREEGTLDEVWIRDESCVIKDSEFPLIDWYAVADIVVTDYSGVAVEAAAAEVASYYYIYDIDEYKAKRGLNVDLREEVVGKYAFKDANELAAQVLSDFGSIEDSTYDYKALSEFKDKYLEVPLEDNAKTLAEFILNC